MASNLNPKTAGFTTTGVLLGAEQYPSAVQQGVANNTGYCLYGPQNLITNMYGWRVGDVVDPDSGTQYGYALMRAGVYDLYGKVVVDLLAGAAAHGTWTLKLNGTHVADGSSASNDGTVTAFEIASDGWKTCTLTCSTDAGNIQLSYWTVAVRQYA